MRKGHKDLFLPVLLYHHVGPFKAGTYPSLTISPQRFKEQIEWLVRHEYTCLGLNELSDAFHSGVLPRNAVLLTFDDAYRDLVQYALPQLRDLQLRATVFVVTSMIGETNKWDEVRGSHTHFLMEPKDILHWSEQGIDFGAHSRNHCDLRELSEMELEHEIAGSRNDLENLLQKAILAFSYPYGYYNDRVRNSVSRSFQFAFTMRPGANRIRTDRYLLHRTMVQPTDRSWDYSVRVRLGWHPPESFLTRLSRIKHGLFDKSK